MTSTVRLCDPGELLAILPYHLGFHPLRSAVLVAFRGTRLRFVQRVDLPPTGVPIPDPVLDVMASVLEHGDADRATLISFDEGPLTGGVALRSLRHLCQAYDLDVEDELVVSGDRWRSARCEDPSCCPPEGRQIPGPQAVPAVAEWVGLGVVPLPDRDAVGAMFDPTPRDRVFVLPPIGPHVSRRQALRAWSRVLGLGADGSPMREPADPVEKLDDEDVAAAVGSLRDKLFRDALLDWLSPGVFPPDALPPAMSALVSRCLGVRRRTRSPRASGGPAEWAGTGHLPVDIAEQLRLDWRMRGLARRLPPGARADVLAMVAGMAWRSGDGAVAAVAADKALEDDPGHTLAGLLGQLIAAGVRPERSCA